MKTMTLSSKNQIVIPSYVRSRLGISSGNKLIVKQVSNDELVLKKAPDYKDLIGTLASQKQDPVNRIRAIRDNWA